MLISNALVAQQVKVKPHWEDSNLTYARADKFKLPADLERLKFGQTSETQVEKLFGEPTHIWHEHPRGTGYSYEYYQYDAKGIRLDFLPNKSGTDALCSIRIFCTSNITFVKPLCGRTIEEAIKILGKPTFRDQSFGLTYLTYRTSGKKHEDVVFEYVNSMLSDVRVNK